MMPKIIGTTFSDCTNLLRFECKFTRREFSREDFYFKLLLPGQDYYDYMSVILKKVDKFDTMKNTKRVFTHISGMFWSDLCLN